MIDRSGKKKIVVICAVSSGVRNRASRTVSSQACLVVNERKAKTTGCGRVAYRCSVSEFPRSARIAV